MTSVTAVVPEELEGELVAGFRDLLAEDKPEGLLRTELLHGADRTWHVQTLWRDREAVLAARQSGRPPAALVLLERLGVEHRHGVLQVVEEYAG